MTRPITGLTLPACIVRSLSILFTILEQTLIQKRKQAKQPNFYSALKITALTDQTCLSVLPLLKAWENIALTMLLVHAFTKSLNHKTLLLTIEH